ncbi:MAG: phosphatidylserine decarboxylase [Elusimicrobiota bacterium]|jgi:phosphatidylserine decarboxylase|nr:phosphatidylserine decarboxylase [Elusimicrobiota bacterium]
MGILREGRTFIFTPVILGFLVRILGESAFWDVLAILLFLIALFCCYFFRDPAVKITKGDNLVLSPCNGTVLEVSENESEKVIRVFLSVFDVHLQRSPISGKVLSVEHKPGKFLKAMDPQAHIVNEQNIITISSDKGIFVVKQIAGILARRCVSWVKEGDALDLGQKLGLIKFSSQVDLHMPKTVDIKVQKGSKTKAGITVLGEIR